MNSTTYSVYPDEKSIIGGFAGGTIQFSGLISLFDSCAAQYPHQIAIKFDNDTWTYKQVSEVSDRLAGVLTDDGIKRGDIVGLALERSPEMIVSLLAILRSGAAYLPLDPSYPKDRVEYMLADASAKMLLTSKKFQKYFSTDATELLIEDAWPRLDDYKDSRPLALPNKDDLAYVLYTSGSTGKPKGVQITHQNLVNFLLSMKKVPGITANDKLLAISTISFDIAGLELYLPLIAGAQIVLTSAATAKDGWLLLQLMKSENITMMQATPYTWRMILAAGWSEHLPIKIITGGEPLPKDLADKLLPCCNELWNQYGPTETTVYSTQKLIKNADNITIGKPVDNTRIYILDESFKNVNQGATGEIVIGGDGVAKGYFNKPELTAERFIDDPFSGGTGAKMYRTGDLGRIIENGEIQCLGRIDHQVKIRGFRIELEEIEYVLSKADGVKAAVAAVWNDNAGDARLAAYIVPAAKLTAADAESKKDSLRQLLLQSLPAYMVPDDFVFLPAISVTPNGKIDRKALPQPVIVSNNHSANYIAPKTDAEKKLVKIWEQLMGLEKVGITDNFFSLGGHSLVAVQMMARIEKITGRRLPIATLLEYPTVQELALHLGADNKGAKWNSLVPIKPNGSKTPLYIIHGEGLNVLYFKTLALQMNDDQPVYGLQARGLKGDEPLEVMEEIAANYVREILTQNPTGPYFLAGYSFGGYIAVEMRKQLVAKGKDVRVIIFDTDAEKSKYRSWFYLFPKKVKRHLPRIVALTRDTITHPVTILRDKVKSLFVHRPALKADSAEFYRQIKKIRNKLRTALYNYSIEPFDDKIYLYKAKICTHYVEDTEFLGWKKYAKKGVEIYEVSGDHLSMLLHPNVEEFAVILQRGIDKLQEDDVTIKMAG